MTLGWILIWLIVLGIGAWLLNAFVGSAMAGWSALARQFPIKRPPTGTILRDCILGIAAGPGLLNSVNRSHHRAFGLRASPDGLYLDAGSPTRIGWPALLIPWSDIAVIANRNLFGKQSFELRLGRSVSYITVTQPAFQTIAPFLSIATAAQQVSAGLPNGA